MFGKTMIRSDGPATKIIEAVRKSGELTVEAWIRTKSVNQSGPARIVSISQNPNERNFTIGQDGDKFDFRLRTTRTSGNGIPSIVSSRRSVSTRLIHVVYTRDRQGRARTYIDGRKNAEKTVSGDLSNWSKNYRLGLANELSIDRPWLGTFHLVAIYNRDLSQQEVEMHFKEGPAAKGTATEIVQLERSPNEILFEAEVAPLIAKHCLECHDTATAKGKLDLSRKSTAFAQRKHGKPIVPGKLADSLLWESIASNEMPDERPPLSDEEKAIIKKWIENGAHWTTEVIDPSIFRNDGKVRQNWVRRLTISEYIATVTASVGVDVGHEARQILPADLRADGFNNTAYNLGVDFKHVEAYSRLAEIVAEKMDIDAFTRRFGRSRKLIDKDNRALIAAMGKWLLRGPLREDEIVTYRGIATTAASAGGDFREAMTLVIESMLQSPRFIYRIENQRGAGAVEPVNEYELASRLSYIIWGASPDRELMSAADSGDLFDRNELAAHVKRMLGDSRAVERSLQFVSQWLDLERLNNLRPNAKKFPKWNAQLAGDMRDETLAYFREVVWQQKRPLAELLNSQVTFATPRLAAHYGLKPQGDGLARYNVASVPGRGGILTHGSVLTVGGDEASMVSRGLFVLKDLLRGFVKDPPPCVNTTPVPTKEGLTQRGIAEQRIANVACGGCHIKFEPLAFGLEKFDGIGAFHEKDEHGNVLRDDGQILFPGTGKPINYQTSAELMNLLARSDRVSECLTWKVAQFALGRPLTATDAPILDKIHREAQKNGGTYASLITSIVMSDLVQMTRTED